MIMLASKPDQRSVDAVALVDEWRHLVGDVAGVKELQFSGSTNTGGGSPIDFRMSGPHLVELEANTMPVGRAKNRHQLAHFVHSNLRI